MIRGDLEEAARLVEAVGPSPLPSHEVFRARVAIAFLRGRPQDADEAQEGKDPADRAQRRRAVLQELSNRLRENGREDEAARVLTLLPPDQR